MLYKQNELCNYMNKALNIVGVQVNHNDKLEDAMMVEGS